MAKLVQFWQDRGTLLRAGVVWAIVFQLVLVVFWYVNQNVSFATMSSANVVNIIHIVFMYLEGGAVVLAFIGVIADLNGKRKPKNDGGMMMADGRRMIKK